MARALLTAYLRAHTSIRTAVTSRKRVLVICQEPFHYHHARSIVGKLAADGRVEVDVMSHDRFPIESLPADLFPRSLAVSRFRCRLRSYDMTLELDFSGPWHGAKGFRARLPHGMGFKSAYISSPRLAEYDAVFTVGPAYHQLQSRPLGPGTAVERVGLAITDGEPTSDEARSDLRRRLGVRPGVPVVLYAPSWTNEPALQVIDEPTLAALAGQDSFVVVARLHALLFEPGWSGGVDWRAIVNRYAGPSFVVVDETWEPMAPYLDIADALVTDISSVAFEFLLRDRPIVLRITPEIIEHYDAAERYERVSRAMTEVQDPSELVAALDRELADPARLSAERRALVDEEFYNLGCATGAAVEAVYRHLGLDSGGGA